MAWTREIVGFRAVCAGPLTSSYHYFSYEFELFIVQSHNIPSPQDVVVLDTAFERVTSPGKRLRKS